MTHWPYRRAKDQWETSFIITIEVDYGISGISLKFHLYS